MQFFGASTFLSLIGTSAALNAAAWFRFLSFVGFFAVQSGWLPSTFLSWYHLHPMTPITFVIVSDLLCRLATQVRLESYSRVGVVVVVVVVGVMVVMLLRTIVNHPYIPYIPTISNHP